MTKLPRNVKGKQLIKALQRLDFNIVGKKGSHVRLEHSNGRWTQVAVHPKPIPQGTLRTILRQTGITVSQLIKLIKIFL
ncbi:MAG: type II toxin-antitoxin system HicA family toxin [Candidatus Roizmanbacteria bacterium]|nr:type II toxin-antitoxin system HicA family toxin [Candidatus Roizmanbacteria bacterium]